jgi:hypothetical protein
MSALSDQSNSVPRWQYEAFRRWFLPSKEAQESRLIKVEAERQAGER